MKDRPSVGQVIEVLHCGKYWPARVQNVDSRNPKSEVWWVVKDWDLPQFSRWVSIKDIKPL